MATAYRTPGVYVEEIPKFPPSIAPVETAVPAFIGYTEKAMRNGDTLLKKATRIESIAEYEELFGYGPSQNVKIILGSSDEFIKAEATGKYFLYDALRIYYANGGGKCYIVSVGDYNASAKQDFLDGLLELEKEDEPTILLFPDAVGLAPADLYDIQINGLGQCLKLMDRVVLCDLVKSLTSVEFKTQVDSFRNSIGINALRYGAAYGPWINANLPRKILLRHLNLKRDVTNTVIALESLTSDASILAQIAETRLAAKNKDDIKTAEEAICNPLKIFEDVLKKILDEFRLQPGNATNVNMQGELRKFSDLLLKILDHLQTIRIAAYPAGSKFNIVKAINDYLVTPRMKDLMKNVIYHHKHLDGLAPADKITIFSGAAILDNTAKLLGYADGAALIAEALPANFATDNYPPTVDTNKKRADVALQSLYAAVFEAIAFYRSIQSSINEFEKSFNDALLTSFSQFKSFVTKGAEALNLIPPSGAIAGVYASVDRDRGVWKAPANVSLNAVISPALKITHEQQGEYNVDVVAGKSINIIRSFTGKGTLVWGARTLAGNDNEWRYVSVRRFFNFVEESVKKATEQFVFEPNDANTWVKVQAMIENFLTTLWRQGALQGIKPEHAFYVAVGIGKTMTALDILEGRMIIEIGMAAVRPAEFIILRFSHKMAES